MAAENLSIPITPCKAPKSQLQMPVYAQAKNKVTGRSQPAQAVKPVEVFAPGSLLSLLHNAVENATYTIDLIGNLDKAHRNSRLISARPRGLANFSGQHCQTELTGPEEDPPGHFQLYKPGGVRPKRASWQNPAAVQHVSPAMPISCGQAWQRWTHPRPTRCSGFVLM